MLGFLLYFLYNNSLYSYYFIISFVNNVTRKTGLVATLLLATFIAKFQL